VLMAAGTLTLAGLEYAIAHHIEQLNPATARTLNFLSQELFLPVLAGAFIFAVASGLAILRGAPLPKWLGWAAIVLGIAALVPPAGVVALPAFLLWSLIVSVLMYMRLGRAPAALSPA
jgi:hypothetical protein